MVGLLRSLVFLILLVVLAVAFSLRNRGPSVRSITPATALDDAYRPVEATTVFGPNDTFFVSVKLAGYGAGDPLHARWYFGGSFITETSLNFDHSGDIDAGFVLLNENPPWPVGSYRVDIVYDGEVLGTASFRVESGL